MLLFPLLLIVLFPACSSIDLPTVEESESAISRLRGEIERAEQPLRLYERRLDSERDIVTALRLDVVNRFLGAVASQRSDDLTIVFPPTRPLLSERKSILGISYTNYLDIENGEVRLNLRRARIVAAGKDRLRILLELQGDGQVAVSGRYTGIPAKATPRIQLEVRDTVSVVLRPDGKGCITMSPARETVLLRATLFVNLAGWEVPWEEEIELQLAEILPAVTLPGIVQTEIKVPVPAKEFGPRSYEFVSVPVELRRPVLELDREHVRLRSDLVFP